MKISELRELTDKRSKLIAEQYDIINKAEQNMPKEVVFSFNTQKMITHDSNESLEDVEKEFLPESVIEQLNVNRQKIFELEMKIRNSTLTRTENLSNIYRVNYTAFKTELESYLKKYYKVNNVEIVSEYIGKVSDALNKCKVVLVIDGKTYSLDNCTLADNQLTIYPLYMSCLGIADWAKLIETYPTIEEAFWKAIELNSKTLNEQQIGLMQNRLGNALDEIAFLSTPTLIQKRLNQLLEEKQKYVQEIKQGKENIDEFSISSTEQI